MSSPLAIMGALPEEITALLPHLEDTSRIEAGGRTYHQGRLFGREVVVVFARLGKVAAASTATHLVGAMGCREIVFTGVAGGVDPSLRIGDVVVARDLYQHDLDASPIFPRLEVPLLRVSSIRASESTSMRLLAAAESYLAEDLPREITDAARGAFGIDAPRVVHADIASGAQFFSSAAQLESLRRRVPSAAAVEMEGAAVAQVCYEHGVPFSVVRVISDSADESAPLDFPRFVAEIASHYSLGIVRRLLNG